MFPPAGKVRSWSSSPNAKPAATASSTKCWSTTCNSVRSPSGAAMAIATRRAFSEHGEKSTGTSISADVSIVSTASCSAVEWSFHQTIRNAGSLTTGGTSFQIRNPTETFPSLSPGAELQFEADSPVQLHRQFSYSAQTLYLWCRLPYASKDNH